MRISHNLVVHPWKHLCDPITYSLTGAWGGTGRVVPMCNTDAVVMIIRMPLRTHT